ncbi:O-antigen ligase family protein [Actinospongicola halichondriae]|uniref:O-antigen ligase family protein n=1 Tax=Actinospongicola halichondriae TaxID=3236844 RepID=UPI003D4452B3
MSRLLVGATIALSVLVAAGLAQFGGGLAMIAAGGLLVANVILLRWSSPGRGRSKSVDTRIAALLAASWLVMAITPMHNFSYQSTAAATSSLSIQTAGELVVFTGIGAFSAFLLRTYLPLRSIGASLTLTPVWVIASASWGGTPAYAVARGIEYVAIAFLALATVGLGARNREALELMATRVIRWLAGLTVFLIPVGFALGPMYVVMTAANRGRFTWAGAHPTESGFLLGAAVLVFASTRAEVLGIRPWMRGAGLLVTAAALFQNQTRTALAGVAVGIAVIVILDARAHPDRAAFQGFLAFAGAVGAVAVAGGALGGYALRGGSTEDLTSLNGRSDLWAVGFDALHGPLDWILGLGFGATRRVFIDDFAFAGTAHNSLLGTLVGLGLVGVVLLFGSVLRASVELFGHHRRSSPGYGATYLSLLAYTLVAAATRDNLAEPQFGIVFVYLCAALAIGASGPSASDDEPSSDDATPAESTAVVPPIEVWPVN